MLTLTKSERLALWRQLIDRVEHYIDTLDERPVSQPSDPGDLHALLEPLDFRRALSPYDAIDFIIDGLWRHQIHTAHARYYGLFNPNPTTMGIAADLVAAAFNPQLAAWGHSPLANEIEQHVLRQFAARFGYDAAASAGSFTTGGAEANHTGLLVALCYAFPSWIEGGVRALPGEPVVYVSDESHHSFAKAARLSGLGDESVTVVPLNDRYLMDVDALRTCIHRDRANGKAPFLVVATMGTTNAGLLEPVDRIADVASEESLWLHADAAWGGAAALVPELRPCLGAIERADSITFDAHKWLSVPMGAGMFFTRHPALLERTFAVDTQYMPLTGEHAIIEPHRTTIQWSRRFIGLKVFLSLLVAGWDGYERALRHQNDMGNLLREKLIRHDWGIVNDTPLPTVCWNDARDGADNSLECLTTVARRVNDTGNAWISTTRIGGSVPALRATITNYRTQPSDLDALLNELETVRASGSPPSVQR
ncbi:MAG: pyridoxal-dependent decarboxylase [Gemmatimonadales bacterium]|jgi:glutamate/tyrosine decarboxylase-like PLP-dependent enzyme